MKHGKTRDEYRIETKQDRHSNYQACSRVAVEQNKYYRMCVCACRLDYPACNAYALFCVVRGLSGSTGFSDIFS
jgi:hypothetical protein